MPKIHISNEAATRIIHYAEEKIEPLRQQYSANLAGRRTEFLGPKWPEWTATTTARVRWELVALFGSFAIQHMTSSATDFVGSDQPELAQRVALGWASYTLEQLTALLEPEARLGRSMEDLRRRMQSYSTSLLEGLGTVWPSAFLSAVAPEMERNKSRTSALNDALGGELFEVAFEEGWISSLLEGSLSFVDE